MSITVAPAQSLTERFAFAVELVLRGFALSVPRSREVAPLALSTWNRLRRLVARFSALVAAVEAGQLSTARRFQAAGRRRPQLAGESRVRTGQAPQPQSFGWLLALAPELNTRIGRAQIETLLADQALLALLAQAPQAGRILRPLCHMLRIERPACLLLPPRPQRPRPPSVAAEPKQARAARPSKQRWLCWPKSPPLPGMEGVPPARAARGPPPE